jgi:hypothetical protein
MDNSLPFKNSDDLLNLSRRQELYGLLVAQLQKDYSRAGLEIELAKEMPPEILKQVVQKSISQLFRQHFDAYLHLMYIIDVSERELALLQQMPEASLPEELTFLLLKREFQKVSLKSRYS